MLNTRPIPIPDFSDTNHWDKAVAPAYSRFRKAVGTSRKSSSMELMGAAHGYALTPSGVGYLFVQLLGRLKNATGDDRMVGSVAIIKEGGGVRVLASVAMETSDVVVRGPWKSTADTTGQTTEIVREASRLVLFWMTRDSQVGL